MVKSAKPHQTMVEAVAANMGEIKDEAWVEIGLEIIRVVDESNAAYGDSTEKSARIMAELYPNGVQPEQLHDFRCMMSILDKLSRIDRVSKSGRITGCWNPTTPSPKATSPHDSR